MAHDPENATLDAWRKVRETNLDGVFLGCKYAIKAMRITGEGSIINISSRSGLVGIPTAAAYASSKTGGAKSYQSVALYCTAEYEGAVQFHSPLLQFLRPWGTDAGQWA